MQLIGDALRAPEVRWLLVCGEAGLVDTTMGVVDVRRRSAVFKIDTPVEVGSIGGRRRHQPSRLRTCRCCAAQIAAAAAREAEAAAAEAAATFKDDYAAIAGVNYDGGSASAQVGGLHACLRARWRGRCVTSSVRSCADFREYACVFVRRRVPRRRRVRTWRRPLPGSGGPRWGVARVGGGCLRGRHGRRTQRAHDAPERLRLLRMLAEWSLTLTPSGRARECVIIGGAAGAGVRTTVTARYEPPPRTDVEPARGERERAPGTAVRGGHARLPLGAPTSTGGLVAVALTQLSLPPLTDLPLAFCAPLTGAVDWAGDHMLWLVGPKGPVKQDPSRVPSVAHVHEPAGAGNGYALVIVTRSPPEPPAVVDRSAAARAMVEAQVRWRTNAPPPPARPLT